MKLLTTSITALALATAGVMPAQAGNNDLAKAIAGIAAIAIIAKAVDDRSDRRKAASATVGASRLGSVEQTYRHDGRRIIDGRVRPYDNKGPKAGRGYKKQPLPQACLRVIETSRRDRLAYGSRCLDRNFRFASKLPRQCAVAVRTNRGVRTFYGARCLDRDGWRVASR